MALQNLYGAKGSAFLQTELNDIFRSQGQYTICRGGQFTRLKGANLDGLNLANRNLKEIDFSGTSLVNANLYGSNLTRASLYCADLRGCDLRNTNLAGADIRGASFKDANLSLAILDGADLRAGRMMYVGADGEASIVARGDLSKHAATPASGVNFSNASMKGVQLGNAKLDNVIFDGALLNAATFRGAKLSGASFRGAVLIGVNLKELGVSPEALKDCVLDVSERALQRATGLKAILGIHGVWVSSGGKQGVPAVLDGEDLRPLRKEFAGRSLIGISACNVVAVGVSFADCQLQGAKFDGADLRDVDFSNANLNGVSLKGSKLAYARFGKTKLQNLPLLKGGILRPDLTGAEATREQFEDAIFDENVSELGLPTQAAQSP